MAGRCRCQRRWPPARRPCGRQRPPRRGHASPGCSPPRTRQLTSLNACHAAVCALHYAYGLTRLRTADPLACKAVASLRRRRALCPRDRHIGRQLQLLDPPPGNPVPDRPADQMPIRRTPQIPWLVHVSRHVLARVDRLTGLPAAPDLRLHVLHAGPELRIVIECRHHHMPPLPPLRVIAVMTNDKALDAVVLGVNTRHKPTVSPAIRHHHPQKAAIRAAQTRAGRTMATHHRGWP